MRLVFVYNARSGTLNSLIDSGHKLLHPNSYSCRLCQLTHGLINEKKAWTDFRDRSDFEFIFYHKDEFEKKYPTMTIEYPAILKEEDNSMKLLFDSDRINSMSSLDELIQLIESIQS